MSNAIQCPTCSAIKLTQAKMYLKRAEQILEDENLMHTKLEDDFFSISLFCTEGIDDALRRTKSIDVRQQLAEMEREERYENL